MNDPGNKGGEEGGSGEGGRGNVIVTGPAYNKAVDEICGMGFEKE